MKAEHDILSASVKKLVRNKAKDDNLGELMSTVCGCTCEGGQVRVHARRRGVGDGAARSPLISLRQSRRVSQ